MKQVKLGWVAVSMGAVLVTPRARAQEPAEAPATAAPVTPVDSNAARQAEAEQRRLRALAFYDSGDYAAARSELAHANQLMPSFRLLYNLAVVSLDLADPASAYDYFERYLAEGGELVPTEKRVEVLGQLHDLAAHIATVAVFVDRPGAEVFIDDVSVGSAPLGHALHVNPGTKKISARVADGLIPGQTLVLAAGSNQRITLHVQVPAPTMERARTPVFWPGWVATAVLSTGAAFAGFEALSAQHDYNRHLDTITSRAELDRLDSRATRWSVTADTLGAAAIIVGVYSLYLTVHHVPMRPEAAKNTRVLSVQLRSNQIEAGVSF